MTDAKVINPLTKRKVSAKGKVAAKLLKQHKNKEISLSPTTVKIIEGEDIPPLNALFQQLPGDLQRCIKQKTFEFEEDVQANITLVKKMRKCMPKAQFEKQYGKMSLCDVYLHTIEKIVGGFHNFTISPKADYASVTKRVSKVVKEKLQKLKDLTEGPAFDVYYDEEDKKIVDGFPVDHHAFLKLMFVLNVLSLDDDMVNTPILGKIVSDFTTALAQNKKVFAAVDKQVRFVRLPLEEMSVVQPPNKHLVFKKQKSFVNIRSADNIAKIRNFVGDAFGGSVPDLKKVLKFVDTYEVYLR